MKNNLHLFLSLLIVVSILSCKHEPICLVSDGCSATGRYMPLAVGNYWIYEVTRYNSTTYSGTLMPYSDTIRVVNEAILNGNKYYLLERDSWLTPDVKKDTVYWRDSVGYIVDRAGTVQFTAIDFDRTLRRWNISATQYVDYSVKDSAFFELTPAGFFQCLDYAGCFWNNDAFDERKLHNYYSEGVGMIYQNIYYASGGTIDFRRSLMEYHLEE